MEIPAQMENLLLFIHNPIIILYIVLFFIFIYLLISLLTWSFIKPLKYLGIPTIIAGFLFIIIRFCSNLIINLVGDIGIIKVLLPNILKPILINGIICLLIGVLMITLYTYINKHKKTVTK